VLPNLIRATTWPQLSIEKCLGNWTAIQRGLAEGRRKRIPRIKLLLSYRLRGCALIPLAKSAGLTVVATASRPETSAWCGQLGTFPKLNTTHLGPLSAENLRTAHRQLESATTIGKHTLG